MRETYNKYGSIFLIVVLFFIGFLIVKPYILSIISAAVVAYIFYPIYTRLLFKIKKKSLAAFFMCIFVLLIVVLPLLYVMASLIKEIPTVYSFFSSVFENIGVIQNLLERFRSLVGININLESILSTFATTLANYVKDVLTTVPEKIVNLSLSAFFLFFFFKDGDKITHHIQYYLPFSKKDTMIIFRQLKETADAVIFGQLVTAFVQSLLATVAYFVLGVNAPLFWGIVTFIFSIIPFFGPYVVYVPLSISLIAISLASHDSFGIIRGVFLFIYGVGVVSSIDNILRPFLISDKVRIHPGFVLVGILGGLSVFGIIGVVIGPLVIALIVTIFNIYEMKEEFSFHAQRSKGKK